MEQKLSEKDPCKALQWRANQHVGSSRIEDNKELSKRFRAAPGRILDTAAISSCPDKKESRLSPVKYPRVSGSTEATSNAFHLRPVHCMQ